MYIWSFQRHTSTLKYARSHRRTLELVPAFDELVDTAEDRVKLMGQCRFLISIEVCLDDISKWSFRFADAIRFNKGWKLH